jgi:protein SCO1/2
MKRNNLYVAAGLLGIVILALAGYLLFEKPYQYHGSVIDPPFPAKDFTLADYAGDSFQLGQQRGKLVLLFFGYTSCPDVCPTTLATFKQLDERLGAQAADVEVVFVTVDPARDTPAKLGEYLALFSPDFIGLTDDPAALGAVYQDYGVYVEKQDTGDPNNYEVAHTSSVFVIDPNGDLRLTFPYGMSVADMAADVQQLLKEKSN